jgi:hypothetical protein
MKKRNYLQVWCLLALIIATQGCTGTDSPNPKYGMAFNGERERIGLPVLQENWRYNKIIGESADEWINPSYNEDIPYHFKKTVTFNRDTIINETDYYIGQQEFNTIDGRGKEHLYITYYFIEYEEYDKKCDIGWECIFVTATEATSSNLVPERRAYAWTIIDITKEEADSILVSWGLK